MDGGLPGVRTPYARGAGLQSGAVANAARNPDLLQMTALTWCLRFPLNRHFQISELLKIVAGFISPALHWTRILQSQDFAVKSLMQ